MCGGAKEISVGCCTRRTLKGGQECVCVCLCVRHGGWARCCGGVAVASEPKSAVVASGSKAAVVVSWPKEASMGWVVVQRKPWQKEGSGRQCCRAGAMHPRAASLGGGALCCVAHKFKGSCAPACCFPGRWCAVLRCM